MAREQRTRRWRTPAGRVTMAITGVLLGGLAVWLAGDGSEGGRLPGPAMLAYAAGVGSLVLVLRAVLDQRWTRRRDVPRLDRALPMPTWRRVTLGTLGFACVIAAVYVLVTVPGPGDPDVRRSTLARMVGGWLLMLAGGILLASAFFPDRALRRRSRIF